MAGESARAYARRQREKAERHLRVAAAYERGAAGEVETARRLHDLRGRGWVVLHDLRWPGRPRANIDHVAIGPGGVFVIDSKNWSGSIAVRDNVLLQGRRRRERAVAGAAEAALAITGVLGQPAAGVLCFVRDEPLTGWARDVLVCSTATVTQLLESRPTTLHPAAVHRFAGQLTAWLTHGDGPVTGVEPTRPERVRRPRERRRSSMPGRAISGPLASVQRLLLKLGVIGLILLVGVPLAVHQLTSLGHRAIESVEGPSTAVGETVSLPGSTGRPALDVTAFGVVPTLAVAREDRPHPGSRLVAVELQVQNRGHTPWSASSIGTSMSVLGSDGVRYERSAIERVRAGKVLSPTAVARPRKRIEGWAVFELPKRVSVTEVRLWVGPGVPRRVTWRLVQDGKVPAS